MFVMGKLLEQDNYHNCGNSHLLSLKTETAAGGIPTSSFDKVAHHVPVTHCGSKMEI